MIVRHDRCTGARHPFVGDRERPPGTIGEHAANRDRAGTPRPATIARTIIASSCWARAQSRPRSPFRRFRPERESSDSRSQVQLPRSSSSNDLGLCGRHPPSKADFFPGCGRAHHFGAAGWTDTTPSASFRTLTRRVGSAGMITVATESTAAPTTSWPVNQLPTEAYDSGTQSSADPAKRVPLELAGGNPVPGRAPVHGRPTVIELDLRLGEFDCGSRLRRRRLTSIATRGGAVAQ